MAPIATRLLQDSNGHSHGMLLMYCEPQQVDSLQQGLQRNDGQKCFKINIIHHTCLALEALGIESFSIRGTTGSALAGLLSTLTLGPDFE